VSEVRQPGLRSQFAATLRATFKPSGRSNSSEVVVYYFGCLFVSILASTILSLVLEFETKRMASRIIEIALAIPAIALFARRMHDQNRSGWWVLLPIALFSYSSALSLIAEMQGVATRVSIERTMRQLDLIPFFAGIAVLALLCLPGTPGPNRFGYDPRDRES
jgi:uncharacterized membrane protein YhaH (DUF805 family)